MARLKNHITYILKIVYSNIIRRVRNHDEKVAMDASTQTDLKGGGLANNQNNEEEDEEEEEEELDDFELGGNVLKNCGICLEQFDPIKSVQVPRCGHPLCRLCLDRLFDTQPFIRCPFCRLPQTRIDFVKLNLTSVQVLTCKERLMLQKRIKRTINKVDKLINNTQVMIRLERERCRFLSLPTYCTRSKVDKKSPDYLAFLNSRQVEIKMVKSVISLGVISRELTQIYLRVEDPDETLYYDSSRELAKAMVKVLKTKRKFCPNCSNCPNCCPKIN